MHRLTLSIPTGLWGSATMTALTRQLPGPDFGLVAAASAGAALAGLLMAGLLLRHWRWSLVAVPLATTLGPLSPLSPLPAYFFQSRLTRRPGRASCLAPPSCGAGCGTTRWP